MRFPGLAEKKTKEWDPNVPLTAEGGPLDRGNDLRQIAAFFVDGRLFVSRSHTHSPLVLSLMSEARLSGYPEPRLEPVDITRLQMCYEATSPLRVRGRQDDVRMRREVLSLVGELSKRRASDIHVVVGEQSCTVRARIDGLMTHIAEWPPEFGHAFCAAAFTMADASDVNYQPYEYQGARVSNRKDLQLPEGVISLRLQFNPTTFGGRAMIVRLLYSSDQKQAADLAKLGFTPEHMEDFETLRSKPFGINIVAGPTGHGKSTTLQRNITSILQEHSYNIAIYTVEDPPEYPIPGAVQMPVVNASSSAERAEEFSKAISAALRSNPDRIMIGEIRDAASAQLAFEAAMTGHQVWTTLHSNDAMTIPFRMRDLRVDDYKLCDPTLLTGLISQRLVRRLCPHCALTTNEEDISFHLLARLQAASIPIERVRRQNPKGCARCGTGNGYIGRTVVAEIILPDTGFMEHVMHNRKLDAERYWLTHLGGRSMVEHMIDRVSAGEVDPHDAERIMGPLIPPGGTDAERKSFLMARGFSFSRLAFKYEFNAKMRRRFYIKLAQLLENGVSLGPALAQLQLISGKSKRSSIPKLYQRWRREIENGRNFGQCVAPYVPGTEAILLETGADSGHLVDALRNAAETSEQQARVRNAILSNAAYPALLMCMLLSALYMMAFTVIPTFAQILPVEEWQGISYKVAKVSIFIQSYGILLLTIFGVIIGIVIFSLPRWTGRSRLAVEGIIPWSLYRIWQGSSFLLSVAALMNAGIKMDEVSLGKLGKNADPYLAQRIRAIRRGVVSGANLGEALHQTGLVFPDREIIADLRVYAQLRGFDKNLVRITRTWVEELVDKVGGIMKVLNTVVLFLIAIVIGCLVAALYGVVQQIQAQA